jgi:hypothetical protein
MCYVGHAFARFMPVHAFCLPNMCAHRVSVDPGRNKAEKAAAFGLVRSGSGPRVIMGSAWFGIDQMHKCDM